MSMTDFRALCAELLAALEIQLDELRFNDRLCVRARALLAQSEPEGSASMDYARQCHTQAIAALIALEALADAADQFGPAGGADGKALAAEVEKARGILARALLDQPVPINERLPGPEDCDAEDNCWWFDPHADGAWYVDTFQSCYTHWLPATALPTPEATND